MEVIFRDYNKVFFIDNDKLDWWYISKYDYKFDLSVAKHINKSNILYHYKSVNGIILPVYYEHNNNFITFYNDIYIVFNITKDMVKDYTLVNLNLLDEENSL